MADIETTECPLCGRYNVKIVPAVTGEPTLLLDIHDFPPTHSKWMYRCPASATRVTVK